MFGAYHSLSTLWRRRACGRNLALMPRVAPLGKTAVAKSGRKPAARLLVPLLHLDASPEIAYQFSRGVSVRPIPHAQNHHPPRHSPLSTIAPEHLGRVFFGVHHRENRHRVSV